MIKIKNRCCYTVTLILCGTLFLTGLTGCKSREAQFLIDGLQEAKAEVDAESSEEKTSGQKSKKDTDEKNADTEDRQNDDGSSAEFRKKQAENILLADECVISPNVNECTHSYYYQYVKNYNKLASSTSGLKYVDTSAR